MRKRKVEDGKERCRDKVKIIIIITYKKTTTQTINYSNNT
jgi:hypothetical protein